LATLQEGLQKNPDSGDLRIALGTTAAEAGRYDLAVPQFEKVAADHPSDMDLQAQLAVMYQKHGDSDKAVAEFRKIRDLAPGNAGAAALLAGALDQAGRKHEAIELYRKSLALRPGVPVVLNNLAYLLTETGGDLNEALRLADEARQKEPGNVLFADTVGWIYFQKKDVAAALQVFENLKRKDDSNATVRFHLGMTLLALGQSDAGYSELRAARDRHPSHEETTQIDRLLVRAQR
jgi:Flp pilus assembly protein TadD